MSRGQKFDPVHPTIKLGLLRESKGPFSSGEWSREVEAGGRLYRVTMRRGQRVRIAFKPAGQNWGHRWVADVWRADARQGEQAHLWSGEVGKSAGVRGILIDAHVVWTFEEGQSIEGRVVRDDGSPCEGHWVWIRGGGDRTDAEGRFRVRGLGEGPYRVVANGPFGPVGIDDVRGGSHGLEIVVPRSPPASGR